MFIGIECYPKNIVSHSTSARTKLTWWLFSTLFIGAAEGIVGTYFPIIFIEKGGSLFNLSIYTAIISLVGFVQIFWMFLLERFAYPKRLVVSSLAGNAITTAIMSMSNSAGMYGNARVGALVATSAYNQGNLQLRTTYLPVRLNGRVGSLFMAFHLMGASISVFVTGFLYDSYGYDFAPELHLVSAGLVIGAMIILWIWIPEFQSKSIDPSQVQEMETQETIKASLSFREQWILVRRSKGLLTYLVGILVFNFGVGVSAPYFVLDLNQRWQVSSLDIGIIMTINSILQVVIIFLILPIIDRVDRKLLFSWGMLFATIPAAAIALNPEWISPWFDEPLWFWIIIYSLSSIGWGIVNASSLTLILDYVHPKIRMKVVGYFSGIQAVFLFIASILAGILLTWLNSYPSVFLTSMVLRLIGVFLVAINIRPPIPGTDVYPQRNVFLTRLASTIERGIQLVPVSIKRIRRI